MPVQRKTIYVRTSGNDVSGDGTLAHPYRTFQRAIHTIPRDLGRDRWFLDISGLGTENIPLQFKFPAFTSGAPRTSASAGTFYGVYTQEEAINVVATPTTIDTITSSDIVSYGTIDAFAAHVTVGVVGRTWTPNVHTGRFLVSLDPANIYIAPIVSNDATTLRLASHTQPPTLAGPNTLVIVEPSANLYFTSVTVPASDPDRGCIEIGTGTNVGLMGIKISHDGASNVTALRLAATTPTTFTLTHIAADASIDGRADVTLRGAYFAHDLYILGAAKVDVRGIYCANAIRLGIDGTKATMLGSDLRCNTLTVSGGSWFAVNNIMTDVAAGVVSLSAFSSVGATLHSVSTFAMSYVTVGTTDITIGDVTTDRTGVIVIDGVSYTAVAGAPFISNEIVGNGEPQVTAHNLGHIPIKVQITPTKWPGGSPSEYTVVTDSVNITITMTPDVSYTVTAWG